MRHESEYRSLLESRGLNSEQIESALQCVQEFTEALQDAGTTPEEASPSHIRSYLDTLIDRGLNQPERLNALARYMYVTGNTETYIYFTRVLGGRTVYPSIRERLGELAGEEAEKRVFDGFESPPLGSPPEAYPRVTVELVDSLRQELPVETCRRVLAGNHHRIPTERFLKHREWLQELGLDGYLEKVHSRNVEELADYARRGAVWYEQEITPEVVEYVRDNQEIMAGVRDGDSILFTKIPYAPNDYIMETDPVMKRYYMCHCPLAREAILNDEVQVQRDWCYCSGGYTKLRFDILFDTEVEITLLESALDGDTRCRFRLTIPEEHRVA